MFVCFSVQPLPAAQGGLLVGDRRVDLPSFVVVHPRVEPPSAQCSYYHLRLYFFSYPFIYLFPIYLSTCLSSIYLSIYLETELQTAKELRAVATEIVAPKPNLTKATNNRF